MKTYYVKRLQIHKSEIWGIQVSHVSTQLMRVTASLRGRNTVWEWVCTGERIGKVELARLFKVYPVCEFQTDEDLMMRAVRARGGNA